MNTVMEQDLEWYRQELNAREQDIFDHRQLITKFSDGVDKLERAKEQLSNLHADAVVELNAERADRRKYLAKDRTEMWKANNTMTLKLLKFVDLVTLYENKTKNKDKIIQLRKELDIGN